MYAQYSDELAQYDDGPAVDPKWSDKVADKYMSNEDPCLEWIDIRADGHIVGFLIVYLHIGEGRYLFRQQIRICEAYILPSYRKKGLMREAVQELLKGGHDVSFEVYKRNPAIEFWRKILAENGYRCIRESDYFLNKSMAEYLFRKDDGSVEEV